MKNLIFLLLFVTSMGYAQPPINDPVPYQVCDSNNDGFAVFDLSLKNAEILGSLQASLHTINYFETLTDAQNNVNPISVFNSYVNIAPFIQILYVRVHENSNPTLFSTTTLQLVVNNAPNFLQPSDMVMQDNPFDGLAVFDLTSLIPSMINGNEIVEFYSTLADAQAGANPIANPAVYMNTSNPQTIGVRIINPATGCFAITSFNLSVIASAFPINNPTPLSTCLNYTFDLSIKIPEILGALNPSDYTVSFHFTLADATNDAAPLPINYDTYNGIQTIYVRVEENASGDYAITSLELNRFPMPIIQNPSNLTIYENPTDGMAVFDLTQQNALIANGDPNLIISFYTTQSDAYNQSGTIVNPNNFTGYDHQTIWVNVQNIMGCFTVTSFELRVVDSSNIIVFTDANFKAKLLSSSPTNPVGMYNGVGITIDANGDGEIQFTEATAINNLNVESSNIGDMNGIGYFTNLQILNCNNNHLASLNVTGTALLFLSCAENAITSLTLSGLPSNFSSLDCHQNQLTSLDLTGFIGLYVLDCHSNQLASLNTSDLTSVSNIDCSNNALTSLSVTNLSGLGKLNCGNNIGMTSLILNNLPVLNELRVYGTTLGSLNVSAFPSLEYLDCGGAHLNTLTLTGANQLKWLQCGLNQLTTLNTSSLTVLKSLACANNLLSALDVSANTQLEKLFCGQNTIPSLNVSNLTQLNELDCQSNGMTTLQLGANSLLQQINCGYNDLTTLNTSGLPALMNLVCWNNDLTALDISQNVALKYLSANDNVFTTLDASLNTQLIQLSVFNNPNLQSLFVKNGSNEINSDSMINCPNLAYVCADESQVPFITANYPAINVNTFCSFTPGGNFNTITGTALFDGNNNGCDNLDDPFGFLGLDVSLNGVTTNSSVFTNNAGVYNLYTSQPGVYELHPNIENLGYFNISTVTGVVPVIDNSTITQNICITANGIHPDVEVVLTPITPARPGFDATYKMVFKNKGNQVLSGAITFNYNDSILDFVSASEVPASQNTGTLSWNYTSLRPFEKRSITFALNVNSPLESPPVFNGNVLHYTTTITPIAGDEIPADNTFILNQTVVGSYDPNDITCLQGDVVPPVEIGNFLHYVINFENTGTYYAENVVVQDIIDTTQYDISSLQILNASHPMSAKIDGDRVQFIFENINLAAAGGNPPVGGHGNVLFKIRTKGSLVANDIVRKDAKIFFDYNAPITTNIAQTTFALLNNTVVVADAGITVWPNPASSDLNISSDTMIQSVELYDIQGRVLEKSFGDSNTITLDISTRETGIYFLKITSEKGSKIEKIAKK